MVLSRQEYWSGLPEQRALTNISRKNEEAEHKWKQRPAVDVSASGSKSDAGKSNAAQEPGMLDA